MYKLKIGHQTFEIFKFCWFCSLRLCQYWKSGKKVVVQILLYIHPNSLKVETNLTNVLKPRHMALCAENAM